MRRKLRLPVKFYVNTEDDEVLDSMGITRELDVREDWLTIYADAITAYHEDSNGNTTLYFQGNTEPWMIFMSYYEFDELINND